MGTHFVMFPSFDADYDFMRWRKKILLSADSVKELEIQSNGWSDAEEKIAACLCFAWH